MLDENTKNKNYLIFLKKLNEIGIDTTSLDEELSEKIKNSTYSITNEINTCYDGSLLQVILRTTTPLALKINELLPENLRVDKNSIIKVCLLSHLSKCLMFIPNDNQWEVEKRGMKYKYSPYNLALKMGMRSLLMCQELGINFTPMEVEAMTILERNDDDKQAQFFCSQLSTIIKQANELTYTICRLSEKENIN